MVSDKCVMTNICPDGIQNSLTSLKVPCVLFSHSCLELLATNDFFMISLVLLFPNCHTVGIIQCLPFSGWLFPQQYASQVLSISFHDLIAQFILALNISSDGCITVCLSIYPLKDILVFQILAFMTEVVINIQMQVFVWTKVFNSPG